MGRSEPARERETGRKKKEREQSGEQSKDSFLQTGEEI